MRRAWLVVGLLVLFMLINHADKSVIAFAGVQIQHDLGLSSQQFGLLQSSFFWLFAAGALFFGWLSSRVSLRWLLAGLMLTWVATMIPLLGTVSFGVLIACRVILGFAEGPAFALANHAAHSWFPPEKRAMAGGFVSAGASIGTLLAAPILTWIIFHWDWHAAFYVLIAIGTLWAGAWLILGRSADEGETTPVSTVVVETVDAPYKTILKTGTVIGIAVLMFSSYWSTTLKIAWLPVYLQEGLGYDTATAGQLMMLPYGLAAGGAITAGWFSGRLISRGVSRRVARGYFSAALVAGAGISMAGFTLLPQGGLQLVLIALAFSLNTAAFGVALSAIADVVQAKKRGMVLGMLSAIASISGMMAPLVLGFTVGSSVDKITGYAIGFQSSGALMIVGAVIAIFLVNPERDITLIRRRVEETA
ncbi:MULTISPECIES: MFS transporter [unclassified Rhodococcus (in: high G+C Gram-positive bacteria)]|uniref:MFS transporter n=1 Tax=unclassified Rhodococcus (in: high G+C Gram-positive bacteria) TaxID=192944 RepID=UPI00200A26F5|nr:MFS transporter [Rhodococcus sp. HM1]MCK8671468.1 MFS transporter [Rhodococcus sp. HM1]